MADDLSPTRLGDDPAPILAPPASHGRAPRLASRRAAGRAREEVLLDAADRLILASGASGLGLPAVAAEAGAPASSLYHFFPTIDALLAALLSRYNALLDEMLEQSLAQAGAMAGWGELVDSLLVATRAFYDGYPVYGQLMARTGASPLMAAADLAHMQVLGVRFAEAMDALFHLPPVPDLARRLTLAVMIIDRLWSVLPLNNGKISNFAFEESRRMVLSYLANILPPAPPVRATSR